jgi:hypothetical protein
MEAQMKTLIAALTLGTLIAAPVFLQSANAQRLDPARARAIQECMALQNRDSDDPYEGNRGGGGVQWTYQACMADHGQPE